MWTANYFCTPRRKSFNLLENLESAVTLKTMYIYGAIRFLELEYPIIKTVQDNLIKKNSVTKFQ